jgi:hypothetical protein
MPVGINVAFALCVMARAVTSGSNWACGGRIQLLEDQKNVGDEQVLTI